MPTHKKQLCLQFPLECFVEDGGQECAEFGGGLALELLQHVHLGLNAFISCTNKLIENTDDPPHTFRGSAPLLRTPSEGS